jgi:hypothetical protein
MQLGHDCAANHVLPKSHSMQQGGMEGTLDLSPFHHKKGRNGTVEALRKHTDQPHLESDPDPSLKGSHLSWFGHPCMLAQTPGDASMAGCKSKGIMARLNCVLGQCQCRCSTEFSCPHQPHRVESVYPEWIMLLFV